MATALTVVIVVKVAADLLVEGGRFWHWVRDRFGVEQELAEREELWWWALTDLEAAKDLRRQLAIEYNAEAEIARLDELVRQYHGGWDALPTQHLELAREFRQRGTLRLVR